MADEADRSVVLALLQVVFLGKCDDHGLGPRGWPFSCLPDLVADCHESSDYCFSTCLDQFCWDVVNPPPLFYTSSRLLYAVFSCLYQRKTCHFSHSYFTPIPNTHLFISDTDTSPPSLHCPRPSSSLVVPRGEELRTQKLKSHLVRTQSLNILPLKP